MSNDPTPSLQSARLAMLLDALDDVTLSSSERVSLTWLAGFEAHTVEDITVVITRTGHREQTPAAA
jgi:hypothetical protein